MTGGISSDTGRAVPEEVPGLEELTGYRSCQGENATGTSGDEGLAGGGWGVAIRSKWMNLCSPVDNNLRASKLKSKAKRK